MSYLRDLCGLGGLLAIVAGVACWSAPAAAIVAGAAVLIVTILWARAAASKGK
jgi:hypothetical protein